MRLKVATFGNLSTGLGSSGGPWCWLDAVHNKAADVFAYLPLTGVIIALISVYVDLLVRTLAVLRERRGSFYAIIIMNLGAETFTRLL
jgi:hypothetical protein